jgi:acylphosphatase
MSRQRFRAVVYGRVQGVNFRAYTADHARRLGLSGTVRNLPDGRSVAVEAEGDRQALERLLAALREGPRFAWVERVEVEWLPVTGAGRDFRILQ